MISSQSSQPDQDSIAPLIVLAVGTRPEAVKLAPVARALAAEPSVRVEVWATGQHRELAREALRWFEVTPTRDLDLLMPGGTLSRLAAGVLAGFDAAIQQTRPSLMTVQGDTTSAFAAALCAFYQRVPVAHVEAGLRTASVAQPWPEEANRRLITPIAALHFAATPEAAVNLAREGVAAADVHVVGNPVIDALLWTAAKPPTTIPGLPADLLTSPRPLILVTSHRRENAEGLHEICAAIGDLALRFPMARVVFPLHPNPATRRAAEAVLQPLTLPNLVLCEPLNYPEFVAVLARATVCLTDSGGVQEEAPALGTPLIILRDETERPEVLACGLAELVGTRREAIVAAATRWLSLEARPEPRFPFGDGHAAERIARACVQFVQTKSAPA